MTDAPDSRFEDEPRLGDLLRDARERRGLSLSEVAAITSVRKEYLSAIEEGRYAELPEDVYTKNFLRLFAQAVGFDVVRAHELYRSERRDSGGFNTVEQRLEHDREIARDVPPMERSNREWVLPGFGPRLGALLSTLLMVGAVVGLALWGFNSTFFNASRNSSESEADPAVSEAGSPRVGAAPGEQAEGETSTVPRTVRLSVSSTPPGAEVSVDEFPLPGTTPIESAPVTARPSRTIRVSLDGYAPAEAEFDLTFDRNLSFALSPATAGAPAAENDSELTAASEADGDEEPAADGAADSVAGEESERVTLRIVEDSWLEVYQGNARNQGERLAFTTARAGQTLSFPLPVYVYVGNAGGVELSVDGQERGPLGSSGQIRGLAITR